MAVIAIMPVSCRGPTQCSRALAAVMAFAASGHFVQTDAMVLMMPPWVPMRRPLVYATGVLELAIAAALLVPRLARPTGILLMAYLVLIFPSNVYDPAGRRIRARSRCSRSAGR